MRRLAAIQKRALTQQQSKLTATRTTRRFNSDDERGTKFVWFNPYTWDQQTKMGVSACAFLFVWMELRVHKRYFFPKVDVKKLQMECDDKGKQFNKLQTQHKHNSEKLAAKTKEATAEKEKVKAAAEALEKKTKEFETVKLAFKAFKSNATEAEKKRERDHARETEKVEARHLTKVAELEERIKGLSGAAPAA